MKIRKCSISGASSPLAIIAICATILVLAFNVLICINCCKNTSSDNQLQNQIENQTENQTPSSTTESGVSYR